MKISTVIFFLIVFSSLIFSQESTDTIKNKPVPKTSVSEFWNQIDDIFNDPNFENANWGVMIQSLETGEYFYKRNENKLFIPASDLKLFTTSAALLLLGPEYRFSTNVFMSGKIDGSILDGDLIIQGRGDPTISGRFYNDDKFRVFENWADSLIKIGIDEIKGNIIGDDNSFDEKLFGKGWAWDDESYWFSAPSGAISFNDNVVDINIFGTKKGSFAKLEINPNTNYVVVTNNVITVAKDTTASLDVHRKIGTNLAYVYGTVKKDDSIRTYVTVNNPTQYAMVVLKSVLEKNNIVVNGFPIDIDDVAKRNEIGNLRKLFTYYSPVLKEIIKVINKNSENFYSEQLLKTIGLEKNGFGSASEGIKAANKIFQEMGIITSGMNMVDGSGLSRLNLVTPAQIVTLLNYMFRSEYFIPFFNSLPIAGVDGTLGLRMKDTKAADNLRAKTGTHHNVSSISGYVYTADNEPVAFSIIANNFKVPVNIAENLEDLVCLRLANFKRK